MVDLDLLYSQNQLTKEVRDLVDEFMSPMGAGRRYLLGRTEESKTLSIIIDIDGFIDDISGQGTIWNGKPVVNARDVPKDAIVVNCVNKAKPITALNSIVNMRVAGILAYVDFCKAFPDLVPLPNFVVETRVDVQLNQRKWDALRACLFDEESRQVLDDLLKYRLTGDYTFVKQYSFRPADQYFENFLELESGEVFVDAGGYDGDTTELFCMKNPNYDKVFLFEPSSTHIEKAKSRLKEFRAVEFIELGVSDVPGTLFFNSDEGSASYVSATTGTTKIEVTTIDQQIASKVTYIKMDLEGWELKALEGAKRHIIEEFPRLAIAVYHHPSDFWRIFEFVIRLRQDYKIFLRHYTEGWIETVMYFVPK
jgi:FkbM family methyltransferase